MSSSSSMTEKKPTVSHDSIIENVNGDEGVSRVQYDGEGDEVVIINRKKYHRHELMQALGGYLNPGLAPYPEFPAGNAAAVGLLSYSVCTLVLGLYYSGAMGISIPNVIVALAIFNGGIIQTLAGFWELAMGNVFAGVAFASYGPFWFSFGVIFVDAFGILGAYKDAPEQVGNAIGFFLVGWAVFTFLLLMCTLKSTVMFLGLFATLELTFILLAAANFTGNPDLTKAGGIMVLLSSACGFYNGLAGILSAQNSYFLLPELGLPVFGKQVI